MDVDLEYFEYSVTFEHKRSLGLIDRWDRIQCHKRIGYCQVFVMCFLRVPDIIYTSYMCQHDFESCGETSQEPFRGLRDPKKNVEGLKSVISINQ